MTKYLIKLRPLDTFFFSQENKYRKKQKKDKKDNNGNIKQIIEADYFQRSAYFPQQTALLGTLRYCLLQKNGQIPINDKSTAIDLIGERSFQAQKEEQPFGKIKNLSGVFLIDKNKKFYFKNPKDLILKENKETKNVELDYLKKSKLKIKTSLNSISFFSNYVEKDGLSNFLINSESNWLYMDYDKKENPDGVFIEQEKIGITKNERDKQGNRKDKDAEIGKENFFKQIVYKLNKGFSFGFIAEINDEDLMDYSSYVSLGADKSPFKISFEKCEDGKIENKLSLMSVNTPKIVLLSDAYLSDYNSTEFTFAISNTKTFRFLKTEVKKGHKYYSTSPLKNENGNIKRSDKFNLIEHGSVFFFDDESQLKDFEKKLKSEKGFYQIGYNNYKIIK